MIRRLIALAAAALCISCSTASPRAEPAAHIWSCPVTRAIYTLPESSAELRLVKTPHAVNAYSDLAMRVEANRQVFWFSFVTSNGYGRSFIGYIRDPLTTSDDEKLEIEEAQGDDDFVAFDANLRTVSTPQSNSPAPAYMFAPGIGVRFWYDATNRISVPIGMWRLTGCARE